MKQLIIVLVIAVAGVIGVSSLPKTATAGHTPTHLTDWPELLTCPDVDGGGQVGISDIVAVVGRFGADYPDPEYMLLYDTVSNGHIRMSDITAVVGRYGEVCPLIDRQVALATLAVEKYKDPAVAFADGYTWGSQDVPQMGIHMVNQGFQSQYQTFYDPTPAGDDQLRHPFGLVYSDAGGNQPGQLIGVWYIVPVQAVCDFAGIPGPCQSNTVQPVGFGMTNADEDNPNPAVFQSGWHTHTGLCIKDWGTANAAVTGEGVSESSCLASSDYWFSTYGWMLHMYNFVPNPDGRFMKWNTNPDFP